MKPVLPGVIQVQVGTAPGWLRDGEQQPAVLLLACLFLITRHLLTLTGEICAPKHLQNNTHNTIVWFKH